MRPNVWVQRRRTEHCTKRWRRGGHFSERTTGYLHNSGMFACSKTQRPGTGGCDDSQESMQIDESQPTTTRHHDGDAAAAADDNLVPPAPLPSTINRLHSCLKRTWLRTTWMRSGSLVTSSTGPSAKATEDGAKDATRNGATEDDSGSAEHATSASARRASEGLSHGKREATGD